MLRSLSLGTLVLLASALSACGDPSKQPKPIVGEVREIGANEDHLPFVCEDNRSQVFLWTGPAGTFVQRTPVGQESDQALARPLRDLRRRETGFAGAVDGTPIHVERLRKLGFHEHLAWGQMSCWR